jgi:hypothetical protein
LRPVPPRSSLRPPPAPADELEEGTEWRRIRGRQGHEHQSLHLNTHIPYANVQKCAEMSECIPLESGAPNRNIRCASGQTARRLPAVVTGQAAGSSPSLTCRSLPPVPFSSCSGKQPNPTQPPKQKCRRESEKPPLQANKRTGHTRLQRSSGKGRKERRKRTGGGTTLAIARSRQRGGALACPCLRGPLLPLCRISLPRSVGVHLTKVAVRPRRILGRCSDRVIWLVEDVLRLHSFTR